MMMALGTRHINFSWRDGLARLRNAGGLDDAVVHVMTTALGTLDGHIYD
jgi:hypothetical protein